MLTKAMQVGIGFDLSGGRVHDNLLYSRALVES